MAAFYRYPDGICSCISCPNGPRSGDPPDPEIAELRKGLSANESINQPILLNAPKNKPSPSSVLNFSFTRKQITRRQPCYSTSRLCNYSSNLSETSHLRYVQYRMLKDSRQVG